jgi:hypothetical protein
VAARRLRPPGPAKRGGRRGERSERAVLPLARDARLRIRGAWAHFDGALGTRHGRFLSMQRTAAVPAHMFTAVLHFRQISQLPGFGMSFDSLCCVRQYPGCPKTSSVPWLRGRKDQQVRLVSPLCQRTRRARNREGASSAATRVRRCRFKASPEAVFALAACLRVAHRGERKGASFLRPYSAECPSRPAILCV